MTTWLCLALIIVGGIAALAGLAMIYVPAALITGGAAAVYIGLHADLGGDRR